MKTNMKTKTLTIIITGPLSELEASELEAVAGNGMVFEYSRCFKAWGYDKTKHGRDLVVTAKIENNP